ncbi:hypothetical protein AALP_AA1G150500 [Arabis alpina]|uniref:Uncharacterized protein n=1 Tax=Arabis alpina TaxID=50452 RepID=A0A087HNC4_ARAAL|nr:hypothetical protein AALP_AA1G150500 [Arabis alpina]
MSEITKDFSTTEEKTPKPNHERNVSGELDVFEATRYFSDFNNEPTKIEYSRIQIQKQTNVTETRQNRVHPQTEDQLPKPRSVVIVKPQEKETTTRGGGGKLTGFLKSLFRSAGLKKPKSKSKSTPEVKSPRVEKKRRNSCVVVTTRDVASSSPISGAVAWRRRSFDVSDEKLNCESLCLEKKVDQCKDGNARNENDVNGGYDSDSSSESDLFELDLFAKSKP